MKDNSREAPELKVKARAPEIISPLDLKNRRGELLDRVFKNGEEFVVVRKNQPMARLTPLEDHPVFSRLEEDHSSIQKSASHEKGHRSGNQELASKKKEVAVIAPAELCSRRSELLRQLEKNDLQFIIARRGKPVGMLVSPGEIMPQDWSADDLIKVSIVRNLSVAQLEQKLAVADKRIDILELLQQHEILINELKAKILDLEQGGGR